MNFFERYLPVWVAICMLLGVLIGASNFYELAVAVAIALFGVASPVALVTIVGVLVEVPVMLLLVRYANNTRSSFVEA